MASQTKQNLFLLFFSLIFFSLAIPANYGGIDLDASWHVSLAMAIDKNFVFGKDFIFNYGPLGYLNTGVLPKSISVWVMVLFEVFILVNYLIIIRLCFIKTYQKWWLVAVFSLIIFLPWGFFSDTTFTLFYFLLFWLLYAQRTQNTATLFISAILTILIFYIKVNLSIIAYSVFYGSLIYFYFTKVFNLRTVLIVFLIQSLATIGFSFLLNVDIPAYLQASLKIIDAYQDAMAEMILPQKEVLVLLFFEGLILLVAMGLMIKNFKHIILHKSLIYLYILVALAWFLCFKQAHTAVAHYNVFGFFLLMPMLAVLLYLYSPESMKREAGKAFVMILILQIIATQFIRFSMGNNSFKGYLLSFPPNSVAQKLGEEFKINTLFEVFEEKNPLNYIIRLKDYSFENNFRNEVFNEKKRLPIKILNKIGKESIDIVPTDISLIFLNKLNYNPRPIIQSYQANSDWLMKKNGEKYLSKTAPKYVLYRIDSFRGQNPFWVETDLNEAILKNYRLEDTVLIEKDTLFLFNRLSKSTEAGEGEILQKRKYKLNEEILIPKSEKPLRFSAEIRYSFAGKIARLFFQPPYLFCEVTYENGKKENFRVIDKILKGGIFVNQKVTTQKEVANFFLKKGVDNQRIIKMKFWTKHPKGFENEFIGRFYGE